MTETGEGRGETVDPLVLQAENVFAQRQERLKLIDADLLGEPGWDIMLRAFIETGNGGGCRTDKLPQEINESPEVTRRWIGLLVERGVIEMKSGLIILSSDAETRMRAMFSAQIRNILQGIGKFTSEGRNSS